MLWLKRILIVVVMLVLAAFTMAFTLDNSELVHLQFMTLQTPELPLALFIIIGFILGGASGMFLGALGNIRITLRSRGELKRSRAECDRLRRELRQIEQPKQQPVKA